MALSTRLQGLEAEKFLLEDFGSPMDALLEFPKFYEIETVNTCDARCVMCEIDFSKPTALIPDDLFEKIAVELSDYRGQVEKVSLYRDGEPLLDNKIPQRIRRLKDAGVKCLNISTNGSLLHKKGKALLESGLDEIYINIDSLKKEVYEKIRVGLIFENIYENILGFIRLRDELNPDLVIRIQMIVQETNFDEVDDWVKHWEDKLSINDHIVAAKAHNWGSQIGVMDFKDEYDPNDVPCVSLWGTCIIHQNGTVVLCAIDTHEKMPIGNLHEQSIAEIWQNSEELKKMRKVHLDGQREKVKMCDGCTLWRKSSDSSFKNLFQKTISR